MQRILIIGATAAIAEAVARRYASRGASIHLLGRREARLHAIAADLSTRGARVSVGLLDVNDLDRHADVLTDAIKQLGGLDVALIAHGTLPVQKDCDSSPTLALQEFNTNAAATLSLCTILAQRLTRGATLAVISSVAGDRGRASNYVYGSAKAAVSAYLSGLGQALRPNGVNVLTIKPGFVDTPMTASFKKGPLWARPDQVAASIVAAIDKRKAVAYVPRFWWAIMFVIKSIPEFAFRRIKL
jgi:decaprenylphospho-beta-D-erythro-pentofuranosid-2-ulose 2-reductase